MRRVVLAALAAALACATVGERTAPAPPPSFAAVRSIALVRRADDRGGRPRDPLDGLDESLRARGYATRMIDLVADPKPELEPLGRLFAQLEVRAGTPRGERFGVVAQGDAGAAAGAVVADLGVDAVASYHRLEGRRLLPPPVQQPVFQGGFPTTQQAVPVRPPQGALAVVDRSGQLAVFAWGDSAAMADPSAAINAAEAIDLLVRALTGEPAPERDE
jgi:hypothetical protein